MNNFVLIGMGGLGCPLALALAPAGRLVLVDDDVVDLSNLARQILYRTEDVGRPKVQAAAAALRRRGFNDVEPVATRFTEETARALLHDADVVIDGSDNLATKFLVNDACVAAGKPFVIGGVLGHSGQMLAVRPGVDGCYRCLFETPPSGGEEIATCADAGVLGPTCGIVAAWQARAALAHVRGGGEILGKLWILPDERAVTFSPRPGCCAPLAEATA